MWRRNVQSPQLKCVICALVVVCCLDASLSLLLCLFLVALPAWQSVCFELWSCYPKYRPPLRDVFIPAVSLSCWRLTLHPSVLPSIPPSLHPPILVWSFVPQQRGKASDNKQPCVCVCVFTEPLITWEKQDFCLSCSLALSLPLLCACVCFHGHALMQTACGVLRYLLPGLWSSGTRNTQSSNTGTMCIA